MPKISVIVPVYKVEKYIERCVVSLFEQTLNNIEYIFIDDCTPDNSFEIIKSLMEKYHDRLIEEHKEVRIMQMPKNSGLAAVRRFGIINATGDYVIHCDSDDWVDKELYGLLYNKALDTGADVVACPVVEEWGNYTIARALNDLGDNCQDIIKNWYSNCLQMYTVNKLVKLSVYKDNNILPYDGINMWEDNGLMLRVFYYAKGLAQVDGAYYHYFRGNENAITYNYDRKQVDQMIKCAGYLYDFYNSKPDFKDYEKTALALKFLARINLVTSSFKELREYYHLYPESNAIIPFIGKNAFSSKGLVRYKFVKAHLAWMFVLLYKMFLWIKR